MILGEVTGGNAIVGTSGGRAKVARSDNGAGWVVSFPSLLVQSRPQVAKFPREPQAQRRKRRNRAILEAAGDDVCKQQAGRRLERKKTASDRRRIVRRPRKLPTSSLQETQRQQTRDRTRRDSTMCTTSVSMVEINQRLDAPPSREYYHSPSSIAEVDDYSNNSAEMTATKRRKISCAGSSSSEEQQEDRQVVEQHLPSALLTGDDDSLTPRDARSDLAKGSAAAAGKDINEDVALETSSSPSRKRRLSHVVNQEDKKEKHRANAGPAQHPSPAASSSEPESKRAGIAEESRDGSVNLCGKVPCDDVAAKPADDDSLGRGGDGVDDIQCSPVPSRYSRRTLYIEYWSRTDECKERKWDHLDDIAEKYGCAEDHIFDTTLRGRTACLEPNMFPYDTPAGIEHWTLWHVKDLNHEQIKQYVENWIDANAPHVECWNYDDNPERSIDIFHVHVYLQVADGTTVLQGRKFEDLVHEMD